MKKCWNKDSLKRLNAFEIKDIIYNWIFKIVINNEISKNFKISKNIAIEFYKADKVLKQKQTNISNISDISNNKTYSQAYHISHLFDFTKKLNEILALDQEDQKDMKICGYENNKNNKSYETEINKSIDNYYILNIRNIKVNSF